MDSGASLAVTRRRDQLRAWSVHHRRVFFDSILTLLRNWGTSLMTWMVLGIAFALPVLLYLLLLNLGTASERFDGKPKISIYLHQNLLPDEATDFVKAIKASPDTVIAVYTSPDEALSEFQLLSGFGDILDSLDRNPLPGMIELTPREMLQDELADWVGALRQHSHVDTVVVDLAWIERLAMIVVLGERLVMALSVVLALGILLVIGNTISMAIENRRSEIEIVKLVGGTNAFARRPFLYLGFWYGAGGVLMAGLLVQLSLFLLSDPVETLAQSYQANFSLRKPGVQESFCLFAFGSALGIVSAFLEVSKHLHTLDHPD